MKLLTKLLLIGLVCLAPSSCKGSSSGDEPNAAIIKMTSSIPANNATEVPVNTTKVIISFDGVVSVSQKQLITINNQSVSSAISGNSQLTIGISGLKAATTYEIKAAVGALKDSKGNTLPEVKISFATEGSNVTTEGISAEELATKIVVGWNLGNALESSTEGVTEDKQETSWGNPVTTKAMIDAVKAAGFNAVRIPVMWYRHSDVVDGELKVHEKWMNRVKEVVDYCIANDMYVIINTHHESWLQGHPTYADSTAVKKKAISLWTQIANTFANYDDHLLIAGTNEVHVDDNWGAPTEENQYVQNRYNQWFVDAVRATGGKNRYRNLIIQTYCTSPEFGLKGLVIPKDIFTGRLMVEFHFYRPDDFALNGKVYYWGEPYKALGVSSWGQESYISDLFGQLKMAWADKGYPIILGEYGVCIHYTEADKVRQAESRKYYSQYVTSKAKECGMVPFVWDNGKCGNGGENFGIFDRTNGMSVNPNAASILEGIKEGAKTSYPWNK